MTTGALREVHLEPSFCAGSAGNVIVVNWRSKPTKDAVHRIGEMLDRLLASEPAGVGFLALLDKDSPPPDGEGRDAFAAVMKERASRIRGSALVIEGSGLKSAAARVVVAAITLLGDLNPVPQVCATLDEAGTTLARLLASPGGAGMTATEIADAARAVKAHGRG